MSHRKLLSFFSIIIIAALAKAQDPVLLRVDGQPVTKSEFEYIYKKNNYENVVDRKSLNEYLQTFVDFRLKVAEAHSQGLDTAPLFLREFASLRNQTIDSKIADTIPEEQISKQMYQRWHENIEVSHILIKFPTPETFDPNRPQKMYYPADTLETYNKAMEIYGRLLNREIKQGKRKKIVKGEDFEKVAEEVSDDPGLKVNGKPGYLGWCYPFQLVKPFEDVMYNTPAGAVSKPFRSQFGYHILKVHNRRPDPGSVNVSHIMLGYTQRGQDTIAAIKDSLYAVALEVEQQLKSGVPFDSLCYKYSTYKNQTGKGCEMGFFTASERGLPADFKDAAFALKEPGDISPIVSTLYGFHILKLVEKKPTASYETLKPQIKNYIQRQPERINQIRDMKNSDMAKKLNYHLYQDNYNLLEEVAEKSFPNDSVFVNAFEDKMAPLFQLNSYDYSIADFVDYLKKNQPNYSSNLSTEALHNVYETYLNNCMQDELRSNYLHDVDSMRYLIEEYYDGSLYFDIMNKEVWEKAANDTLGLKAYFGANKEKYKFDSPRYKGIVVHCKDKDAMQRAQKALKKNKKAADYALVVKEAFASDSISPVKYEKGLWEKGENPFVDFYAFNKQKGDSPQQDADFPYTFIFPESNFLSMPDSYSEIRGTVVSDYQQEVEKRWLRYLRDNHEVEINTDVLNSIK